MSNASVIAGEVEKSLEGLDQSIECCEAWKEAYNNAAATHNRFCDVKWLLDRSSIFAQIDAFVQRCKDLKEVGDSKTFLCLFYYHDVTIYKMFSIL